MNQETVKMWVEHYITAWKTNAPEDIARLFSEDALYYTGPFAKPWRGQKKIVKAWLARKDEPQDWKFRYEVVTSDDACGVVRGWTKYKKPAREYSNLWVIRFDDAGRCREFTEWWIQRPK